jgi:hypothetical protein
MSGRDDIFAREALDPSSVRGYPKDKIPNDRDRQITDLLREWCGLDELSRRRSEQQLDETKLEILGAYAGRMASLAVRQQDPEILRLALVALALRKDSGDWRDGVPMLALCYDAAERLSLHPEDAFEAAAQFQSQRGKEVLRKFYSRKPEDRSLKSMLYHIETGDEGFRYVRDW